MKPLYEVAHSKPCAWSSDLQRLSGRESWGTRGAGTPPLRIAMNIHSIKLFNNLIKNTLLAPMFCGIVKS